MLIIVAILALVVVNALGESPWGRLLRLDDELGEPKVMEAVIRNTFVQGTLSIVFVVLAIIVIIAAVIVTIAAIRRGGGENHEDEPVASRRFAPAGFIGTASERELEKAWEPILADERAANRH